MHSDFSTMAKAARSAIAVPAMSMETIQGRSRAGLVRDRARILALCGALTLAAFGVGTGVAAKFYDGIRTWITHGQVAVVVDSLVVDSEPMPAELRDVAARAAFPVVFPVGLPAGTRVTKLLFAPHERPTSITIGYRMPNDKHVGFTLNQTSTMQIGSAGLPEGRKRPIFREAVQWEVGRETVIALKAFLPNTQAARVKAAMLHATPRQSLASTEAMARTFPALDRTPDAADAAERLVQAGMHPVVIAQPFLRYLPPLVKQHRPLLDMRITYLTHIPAVHGQPDYANAMHEWPRHAIISANGVRAIDAVFHRTGDTYQCACAILFTQSQGGAYRIWILPSASSKRPVRYVVDARTLAVTRVK